MEKEFIEKVTERITLNLFRVGCDKDNFRILQAIPNDVKTLMKWYEAVELYYHFAKRWEEQERGMTCSVDRAYHRYLKPKCKELLEFLRKFKIHSDEKYEGLMELAGCGYDYLHTGATFEFEIDAEKKIITARQFPKIIRKR